MGGLGHLPEAGGVLDQHAPTMDGLDEITRTMAWLDERFPRRERKAAG